MRIIKNFSTAMTLSLRQSRAVQLLFVGVLSLGLLVQTGCDSESNLVEVPELPTPETPTAPSGLEAASGDSEVELVWDTVDPVDSYIVSYSVYRTTSSGGALPEEPVATGVSGGSYTDAELENGTTYYYRVTSTTGGGEAESEASNEAAVTPFAGPPDRP
ncbi:hypothetical protein CRI93_02695 [Longimonas halophila]|uniref:Fibronectin type-III domain-containing protein n=2 Tax=Longimonas halophila TaxID=1469170 RepID=A0A2H3NNR8_9BACT|nr:hypothetical protein CRI93_02695 [Longimonas halophila]